MKRITLLLLAVAGSLVYEPLNGCGPGFMSEDYRFWLLQPELAESRSLHSFYFTTDHIYETDDQELLEIGYQLNIAEWKVVVGNKVPEEAISTMLRALAELRVDGLKTTVPIHREILSHTAFAEAQIDTTFVERTWGKA